MNDGRTHLAYKVEHAVDLESEAIVAAHVLSADRGDTPTKEETLIVAQVHLVRSGSAAEIQEVVQDKGYHDNAALARMAAWGVRTCVPERQQKSRVGTDKPAEYEPAFRANRRRVRGDKGRRLNRWRSEKCERGFARVCETGGGRRMWLRGLDNARKSHLLRCAGCNLGLVLRKCYGMSKLRSAAAGVGLFFILGLFLMLVEQLQEPATREGGQSLACCVTPGQDRKHRLPSRKRSPTLARMNRFRLVTNSSPR